MKNFIKVLIGIILGIIAVLIILNMGITFLNKVDNKERKEKQSLKIELKKDLIFEINSELKLLSLIDEKNKVEIISEDEIIDTSILGEKNISIKYLENNKEKEYKFKITIIDTLNPVIEFQNELITTKGTEINLLENVKINDNSKEEIIAIVEGDYDFNVIGEYKLKYVAIDSSKNKTEQEFILKVNDKPINNVSKPINNNQNINNNVNTNLNNNVENIDKNQNTDSSVSNEVPSEDMNDNHTSSDDKNIENDDISNNVEIKPVEVAEYRQEYAKKMITLINQARTENGLGELKLNDFLESSAMIRSKEIVTLFSHTRPNQTSCFTTITISYHIVGENIAAGQFTIEEVFVAWMNSEGHRANILNKDFTDIGISLYYDPNSTYKYYWVQMFAGI